MGFFSLYLDIYYDDVVNLYMGYVLCYSLALADYDLTGGRFMQKLEKWLPPYECLSKAPLCLGQVDRSSHNEVEILTWVKWLHIILLVFWWSVILTWIHSKLHIWEPDDDATILNRVFSATCEMDLFSAATHTALVQALEQFREKLPDSATLNEMLQSLTH